VFFSNLSDHSYLKLCQSLCVNSSFAHEVYYVSENNLNCLNVVTGKIKEIQKLSFHPQAITMNEGYPPTFITITDNHIVFLLFNSSDLNTSDNTIS
jgi:hypothetical protein